MTCEYIHIGNWPELLPTMVGVFSQELPEHKVSALHVLSRIGEFAVEMLRPGLAEVKAMLQVSIFIHSSFYSLFLFLSQSEFPRQ